MMEYVFYCVPIGLLSKILILALYVKNSKKTHIFSPNICSIFFSCSFFLGYKLQYIYFCLILFLVVCLFFLCI